MSDAQTMEAPESDPQTTEVLKSEAEIWIEVLAMRCAFTAINWVNIQEVVERHFDKICDKWKQLNTASRKEHLRSGARYLHPSTHLPKHHRPDIEGTEPKAPGYEKVKAFVTPACYMWPHLNEDDLAWDDTFIMYLYHRATTHFLDYQHFDLQCTKGGFATQGWTPFTLGAKLQSSPKIARTTMVKPRRIDRETVRFGSYTFETFYTMMENPGGRDLKGRDTLDKFTFENALWIAKIQSRIYGYLYCVCISLLHGKLAKPNVEEIQGRDEEEIKKYQEEIENRLCEEAEKRKEQFRKDFLENDKANPVREPRLPEERSDRHFPGGSQVPLLAALRVQADYGPPAKIHLQSLEGLIEAKVYDAEATLLLLRGDPGVFEAAIRQERVDRDQTGSASLTPKPKEFKEKRLEEWRDAMKFRIGNAIKEFDRWSALQDSFKDLKRTYEQVEERLKAQDDSDEFSDEFLDAAEVLDQALYSFHHHAERYSEILVKDLEDMVSASKMLKAYITRDHFDKLVLKDWVDENEQVDLKELADRNVVYSKSLKLLYSDRLLIGLSAFLDNLERELNQPCLRDREKNKIEYLPTPVRRILGDLAVFAECLNQVATFQPYATLLLSDWDYDSPGKSAVRNSVKSLEGILKELSGSNRPWNAVCSYGLPKDGAFDYPVQDERTEETVEKLRKAEDNLNKFWDKLLPRLGSTKQNALTERTSQLLLRAPERTPQWKSSERTPQLESPKRPRTPSPDKRPREEDEVPEEESPKKKRKVARPRRTKDENKRKVDDPSKGGKARDEDDREPANESKIFVSEATLESLGFLFHVPGQKNRRKNLSWKTFRKMMEDIGFYEGKNGGSVTKFSPSEKLAAVLPRDRRGEWRVDEPHPSHDIPFAWAREWGRKLRNRYGWEHTSFAERQR